MRTLDGPLTEVLSRNGRDRPCARDFELLPLQAYAYTRLSEWKSEGRRQLGRVSLASWRRSNEFINTNPSVYISLGL